MNLVLLLLGLRWRSAVRGARQNAFALFVLGPLILGGGLLVAGHYLDLVRAPLRAYAELVPALAGGGVSGGPTTPGPLGLALALGLLILHLPGSLNELFSRGWSLDALPMGERARFAVAVAATWGRQASSAAVLLLGLAVLGETAAPERLVSWGLGLMLALLPLALLALAGASLRVRVMALERRRRWLVCAGTWGLLAGALAWPGLSSWLLLPLWPSAAWLEVLIGSAVLGGPAPAPALYGWLAATLVLALGAGVLAVRYRRLDLERAASLARLPRAGRPALLLLEQPAASKALLGRDLLLVARRFSPVVDLAAALAGLLLAAIVLVIPASALDLTSMLRLGVLLSVAATLVITALVPLLLKHQLPCFWSERTSAVAPGDVGQAKLWLARCLALPPTLLGGAALCALPGALDDPSSLGWALAQLLVAEWIVASIVGHTVFEIATQPFLGMVFSSLSGLSIAVLFVLYPRAWWLWLVFYVMLANKLAERAAERVRWTEIEL